VFRAPKLKRITITHIRKLTTGGSKARVR